MATGCWRHSKGTKPLLLALKSGVTTKSVCPPAVKVPASSGTLCECAKNTHTQLFSLRISCKRKENALFFFVGLDLLFFFAVPLLRIMQTIVL